jgi:hypothetical protein
MKKDLLRKRLEKVFGECEMHLRRMEYAAQKMSPFMPLDVRRYEKLNDEEIGVVDQFLFRFSKLQDAMGQRLFTDMMRFFDERVEGVPFVDLLHRMERLGFFDAQEWRELRELRNELAHTYEEDAKVMCAAINTAYEKRKLLKEVVLRLKEEFEKRKGNI